MTYDTKAPNPDALETGGFERNILYGKRTGK